MIRQYTGSGLLIDGAAPQTDLEASLGAAQPMLKGGGRIDLLSAALSPATSRRSGRGSSEVMRGNFNQENIARVARYSAALQRGRGEGPEDSRGRKVVGRSEKGYERCALQEGIRN